MYAVSKPNGVACLIARMGTAGAAAQCVDLRMLASDGLLLRTRIPAELVVDGELGEGIAARAADTDLLAAEWRADGSFVVALIPD